MYWPVLGNPGCSEDCGRTHTECKQIHFLRQIHLGKLKFWSGSASKQILTATLKKSVSQSTLVSQCPVLLSFKGPESQLCTWLIAPEKRHQGKGEAYRGIHIFTCHPCTAVSSRYPQVRTETAHDSRKTFKVLEKVLEKLSKAYWRMIFPMS